LHVDSPLSDSVETSLAGLHVLILEGAASHGEFVSALERHGASVTPVVSSGDAIEALSSGAHDVFVADVSPDHGAGLEILGQVRTVPSFRCGAVPSVAIAGRDREGDRDVALAVGFAAVLAEPVEPEDLVATVAGCRRLRGHTRERREALAGVRSNLRAQRDRMRDQREALAGVRQALDSRRALMIESLLSGRNRILAALPVEALGAAVSELAVFRAGAGDVLCQPGAPVSAVYFPLTSVVSLTCELASGDGAEVGTLGGDGVVGACVAFDVATSAHRAAVVIPGDVLEMTVAAFKRAYATHPTFQAAVNAFEHELFMQAAQIAACNNFHSLEQRVGRWLLTMHRLSGAAEIVVTHELIARLLGVRRAGVTVALGDLDRRGLVRCYRGRVRILDEGGLRGAACECDGAFGWGSRA
jgi:CRP-like cAMP-binding protein/DNA-binding response OmpR family regulator